MAKKDDVRIVVLQRGWVVVGKYSLLDGYVTVDDACVIRIWGTKKGLGELRQGPTSQTQLEPSGKVQAHELAVILTLECDAEKWARHLEAA